ncbi:MAG: GNAT family N-acetyltransferase [Thermoflavifilum sp.]|nr:GNAT family N-acetyltransferase [Thermoflavifilum sp.]MCL6513132.1 GNAT family N-acetyltransferase [Alicyclobacillus sp.]
MFHLQVTPDIRLRLLEPRDAGAVFRALDGSREHLRRWLGFVDSVQSEADTRRFIEDGLRRYAAQNGAEMGIWYQGQLAGVVGLHYIHWTHRDTALGYWLAAGFEGRGIMTAACAGLIDHLFRELQLHRVEIRAAVENTRSRRVAERLGFRYEGCRRHAEWLYDHYVDHALYGLLADEWRGPVH